MKSLLVVLDVKGPVSIEVAAQVDVSELDDSFGHGFGPRYISLASDLSAGREHAWVDVAMDRDSREVAVLTRSLKAAPPDSLFVWGFRPELYVYTGLPAASRFLDSQPVTGVPADRHLVDSTSVTPELAAANRQELIRSRPTLIVDGLGPYNPRLAIESYPDLQAWLADYKPVARTRNTIVYRRRERAAGSSRFRKAPQPEQFAERDHDVHDPEPAHRPAHVRVVPQIAKHRDQIGEEVIVPIFRPGKHQQHYPDLQAEHNEQQRRRLVIPAVSRRRPRRVDLTDRGDGRVQRHQRIAISSNRANCSSASTGKSERERTGSKLKRCSGVGP